MGHSYRRVGVNGRIRYTAIFHDTRGERRSAGTYSTKREADRAWATAESDALLGKGRDPRRGKITFSTYVTGTWHPHHQLEQTTRQRYSYQIEKYLLPEFGRMRMADIAPLHVREWITQLKDLDVSASTIADVKTILSAIFTTALNDQIAHQHPCRGVKTPTVARRPRTIITPDQFDLIRAALPDPRWQLLIDLDIETGLRWGELTELRARDLNAATRMLTVARAAVEINARFRTPTTPPASRSRTTPKTRNTDASNSPPTSPPPSPTTSRQTNSGATTCSSPSPPPTRPSTTTSVSPMPSPTTRTPASQTSTWA